MRFGLLSDNQCANIQFCLDTALQYYQQNYVFNLNTESCIKTHNLNWLTSDKSDKAFQNKCDQEFAGTCEFCNLTPIVCMQLMSLCQKLDNEPLFLDKIRIEKWKHAINQDELAILEYRNFIVRNKMSDIDWHSRFSTDTPHRANVIFDWAMNHLPEKPRLVV